MPKLKSTVGQVMVNALLPEDMRDYSRVLSKKNLGDFLTELGQRHPDKYREVTHKLNQIGMEAAYKSGGNSFGLEHLRMARAAKIRRQRLAIQMRKIIEDDTLSDDQRNDKLVELAQSEKGIERDEIFDESMKDKNPLAVQLLGAGRGNRMNLASLRGSDWLYEDHHGRIIPVPVTRSYSQGLTPAEYWAGTYGARQGVIAVKQSTADAGYFGKQLVQASHRNIITDLDRDGEPDTLVGLPVETDDDDSEGSLLAAPAGGYKRNTVLTPKVLSHLRKQGIKKILLRSPAVSGSPDGGLYARDVGLREFGKLPAAGEQVGIQAAQALSEGVTQASLSAKHTGGVAGESKAVSGFELFNNLVQVPKTFKGGAAHSELDGVVKSVEDAPAGGKYVVVSGERHYVPAGFNVKVKPGDKVEAGDVLSSGIPNPALITKYKGLGEGRRYFINTFTNAMRDAGLKANRRNVELLSRGLINHVRLTDEIGDFAPGDVVPYSMLEHSYQPREGTKKRRIAESVGHYLERPVLHYSIGTQVRPSMLKEFTEFGVDQLDVHQDPPAFETEMIRGMANLQHDPDWQTKMFGSGLKGSLLGSAQRGGTSTRLGTSFVPGRARAVTFGEEGLVKTPKREGIFSR